MDPLAWASLASPVGCVIFLFVALTRGWLVARGEVDRLAEQSRREIERLTLQWDDRLTEAHERELIWQKTAQTTEETSRDVADQLRTRQIVDEAVVKAIGSLPHIGTSEGA